MADHSNIRYGTDLITFYAPSFWGGSGGLAELREALARGGWDAPRFWDRVLDCVREAGLDGVEITFPPGDWRSALDVYGSADGFTAALNDRGLELAGGFFIPRTASGVRLNILDDTDRPAILDLAASYAEFLSACGSDVMVVALPTRRSPEAEPPGFVDLTQGEQLADLLNRMGATALRCGVRLALHPEAFSMFRNSRDVDLFMMLTDPTYVSMCPDTAQFVVAGSDPIRIVDRHRERIASTHWKDAIGAAPAETRIDATIYERQIKWFTGLGEGVVDWPTWMRLLRDMRYTGWALFELDLAKDPVAELKRCRQYVESTLCHIYQ